MSTEQYLLLSTDLANARANLATARMLMENTAHKGARRVAAENVEFWGGKVAFLSSWLKADA